MLEVYERLGPEAQVSLRVFAAQQARAEQPAAEANTTSRPVNLPVTRPGTGSYAIGAGTSIWLSASSAELSAALLEVVRGADEFLVSVGSHSREPAYLREIEHAVRDRDHLTHYRILIGPPRSQALKEHLIRLGGLRQVSGSHDPNGRLRICMLESMGSDHERFFTANERTAVVVLPSVNSPANFDTALVVNDPWYASRWVEHGQALYGGQELTTAAAIEELSVQQ